MQEELSEVRRDIRRAMEYAVPEGYMDQAEELLDVYYDDRIGLTVLYEFYRTLPDAVETWVNDIVIIARQRGIFLLGTITGTGAGYLYLVSSEGIEFQGSMEDKFLADELLDFFEYESQEDFGQACASIEQLNSYEPLQTDVDTCPACHALTGEEHELGCPVEVCPWCGGQLIQCNCRFEQLGLDAITDEEELEEFETLLDERGRIPYSPEQRPSFADEGPGVVFE